MACASVVVELCTLERTIDIAIHKGKIYLISPSKNVPQNVRNCIVTENVGEWCIGRAIHCIRSWLICSSVAWNIAMPMTPRTARVDFIPASLAIPHTTLTPRHAVCCSHNCDSCFAMIGKGKAALSTAEAMKSSERQEALSR